MTRWEELCDAWRLPEGPREGLGELLRRGRTRWLEELWRRRGAEVLLLESLLLLASWP